MENVLLLNASFEPLRVIGWKRALTLLSSGKVEVLEEYGREVRSVSLTMRLPAVVRLFKMIRIKPGGVKFSRQNIYARDRYECQYCGANPPLRELTYDHVIPRALGGLTDWENIVTCCIFCNRRKGGKLLQYSDLRLRRQPRRPGWGSYITFAVGFRHQPESWCYYLAWYTRS